MNQVYETANGQAVPIGRVLGKGGEGTVYSLESDARKVVKIYHQTPSEELLEKLTHMTQISSDNLQSMCCWPESLVQERKTRIVKGFIMPSAEGYREIHKLYGPKSRAKEFPSATWRFLLQVALNVCKTFGYLHSLDHVIGDINHSSVMVKDDATVRLIDCDSIQVKSAKRTFRCAVGEPLHTPPELQGMSLRNVERTTNHDNFGLAVLIFELLFMGRHPYIGQYLGQGHLSPEEKIRMNLFAYSVESRSRIVEPPPFSLSLGQIDSSLGMLFERAFAPPQAGGARPTSAEWLVAIRTQLQNLKKCSDFDSHHYDKRLNTCPWCFMDQALGINVFSLVYYSPKADEKFSLQATWSAIEAVVKPDIKRLPILGFNSSQLSVASTEILRFCKARKSATTLATFIIVFAFLGFAWFQIALDASLLFAGSGLVIIFVKWIEGFQLCRRLQSQAREELAKVALGRKSFTSDDRFDVCLSSLKAARESYLGLGAKRTAMVSQLTQSASAAHEKKYLEGCLLRSANVPGIGTSRKATLFAYGIESAADISMNRVLAIPGFGPGLASDLMQWRLSCLSRYKVNPSPTVDPLELKRIDSQIDAERSSLQKRLCSGHVSLRNIAAAMATDVANLRDSVAQSALVTDQITLDVARIKRNWIL
jgi:DNA-binding helix-hairpin-helix protein with protein kinase domain